MKRSSLVLVDVVGGALVVAGVSTFVWLTFLRDHSAACEIDALTHSVSAMRRDVALLRGTLDAKRSELAERQKHLADEGHLPQRTPVEQDLRTLSELARRHQVRVVRVLPLPAQEYPGLLELRYALEASGSMPSLMHFFKAIEDADLWADIGYLQVKAGRSPGLQETPERSALLTVSLFSSLEPPGAATSKPDTGTG